MTATANSDQTKTMDRPYSHREIQRMMLGLMAAMFTVLISSNIVVNALPTISAALGGSPTEYTWVVTASLLANAVSTPIWSKLSDLFSKKMLMQASIGIFVLGTVASALATSMGILIAARTLQGLAMGGVLALVQSILGVIVPARHRGRYAGYLGSVLALATTLGPLVGGLVVDSPLGWRWCFWLCIPIAVLALALLQATLTLVHQRRPVSVDWAGIGLLTLGVSLLLLWISLAGKPGSFGWLSVPTVLLTGFGLTSLLAFVLVEARVEHPIIPLSILRERTTALAVIASLGVGFAMFGATTFLSQYLQVSRAESATTAGLLLLPLVTGTFLGSLLSGQLITRYGRWKPYLTAGSLTTTVGFATLGFTGHDTSLWIFGTAIALVGVGTGLLQQNLLLAVQNTVDVRDIGAASGIVQFFRALSGSVTIAVFGSVLTSRVTAFTTAGLRTARIRPDKPVDASNLTALPAPVEHIVRIAYGDGVGAIYLAAAVLALFGLLAVLGIKHRELRRFVHTNSKPASRAATR